MSSPASGRVTRSSVKDSDHAHAVHDAAERRRGAATELRKERRHEQVGKRRRTLDPSALTRTDTAGEPTPAAEDSTPFPSSEADVLAALGQLRSLASSPPSARLALLVQVKTWLLHPSAPITAMVEGGVVDALMHELTTAQWASENQVEAVWSLTNIAADSYANAVRVLPASPYLIAMLGRPAHPELQEQAAWTLGNLAGEDAVTRVTLIAQGVVAPLVQLYVQQHTAAAAAGAGHLQHIAAWALSNLFKTNDVPHEAVLAPPFLALCFADWNAGEQHVAVEVSWVLCHLSHHSQALLLELVQRGLVEALRAKLTAAAASLQEPAATPPASIDAMEETSVAGHSASLPSCSVPSATYIPLIRIVANLALLPSSPAVALFSSASPEAASAAPSPPPVLLFLRSSLSSGHRGVRKEAAWAISSLAATGHPLVLESILQAQMLPPLLSLFHHGAFDQQKEAAFALYHLALSSPAVLRLILASEGRQTVATYLRLLQVGEPEGCLLAMRMLRLVCVAGKRGGEPWVQWAEEAGAIDALERMMTHERVELWRMAQAIIDEFWGEEEEEGHNVATDGGERTAGAGVGQSDVSDIPPWRLQAMRQSQQQLSQNNGTH